MKPEGMRLIHGTGDVVQTLEELLEKARAGQIDAVVVATVEPPDGLLTYRAWRNDMPFAWARILASLEAARYWLLSEGI